MGISTDLTSNATSNIASTHELKEREAGARANLNLTVELVLHILPLMIAC